MVKYGIEILGKGSKDIACERLGKKSEEVRDYNVIYYDQEEGFKARYMSGASLCKSFDELVESIIDSYNAHLEVNREDDAKPCQIGFFLDENTKIIYSGLNKLEEKIASGLMELIAKCERSRKFLNQTTSAFMTFEKYLV